MKLTHALLRASTEVARLPAKQLFRIKYRLFAPE